MIETTTSSSIKVKAVKLRLPELEGKLPKDLFIFAAFHYYCLWAGYGAALLVRILNRRSSTQGTVGPEPSPLPIGGTFSVLGIIAANPAGGEDAKVRQVNVTVVVKVKLGLERIGDVVTHLRHTRVQ